MKVCAFVFGREAACKPLEGNRLISMSRQNSELQGQSLPLDKARWLAMVTEFGCHKKTENYYYLVIITILLLQTKMVK